MTLELPLAFCSTQALSTIVRVRVREAWDQAFPGGFPSGSFTSRAAVTRKYSLKAPSLVAPGQSDAVFAAATASPTCDRLGRHAHRGGRRGRAGVPAGAGGGPARRHAGLADADPAADHRRTGP